jgi:hypothetical protein
MLNKPHQTLANIGQTIYLRSPTSRRKCQLRFTLPPRGKMLLHSREMRVPGTSPELDHCRWGAAPVLKSSWPAEPALTLSFLDGTVDAAIPPRDALVLIRAKRGHSGSVENLDIDKNHDVVRDGHQS